MKCECSSKPTQIENVECGYEPCSMSSVACNSVPSALSGLDHLNKKTLNKGLCFTAKERRLLNIEGLMPAAVRSEETQVMHAMLMLDRQSNDINKYMFLIDLISRNEKLFYKLFVSDIQKIMPLVYTPTVGLACQNWSLIYQRQVGLYITIKDKGHVYDVIRNWPEPHVRIVCVTDGERILGLGDLGANGMAIPVGKLALNTALAGIKPEHCMPVLLDCGTKTLEVRNDPLYIGLRQDRVTGDEYDEFIDEFLQAVVHRFGQNCLIHFEDFGNSNAFRLINKYRHTYCAFNDDIQGTAAVSLAGLLASLRIKKSKLSDNRYVFYGAGEAALGTADLLVSGMMGEGLKEVDAKERIWLVDSKGLIVKNRPTGGLTAKKMEYAKEHKPIDTLAEVVKIYKPNVLIGVSTIGGAFTAEILKDMADNNEISIVFPLSNPTHKAECTAQDAYTHTEGRVIFASGSPFAPVTYNGKTYRTGQCNNAYIYPGVCLGILYSGAMTMSDEIFIQAAEKLASLTTTKDLEEGSVYPPLSMLPCCSLEIATSIMEHAYKNGLATIWPEPKDKRAHLQAQMYDLHYSSVVPEECLNSCVVKYKKEKKERREKKSVPGES